MKFSKRWVALITAAAMMVGMNLSIAYGEDLESPVEQPAVVAAEPVSQEGELPVVQEPEHPVEEPEQEPAEPVQEAAVEEAAAESEQEAVQEEPAEQGEEEASEPAEETAGQEPAANAEAAEAKIPEITKGYLVLTVYDTVYRNKNNTEPIGRFGKDSLVYAEFIRDAEGSSLVEVWFDTASTREAQEPVNGYLYLGKLEWVEPDLEEIDSARKIVLYDAEILIPVVGGFVKAEEPAAEEPAEEPAVEEPAVEEPAVEEPAEEPAVEEITEEEPAAEEPAVEEPAEEPAVEEVTEEEPAVEEPAEEPAVEEIAAEELAVEETAGEDPVENDEYDTLLGLQPERSIELTAAWADDEACFGGTVIFEAHLQGYEGLTYSVVWQHSTDGIEWETVEDASGTTLGVIVTEENVNDCWRVEVLIDTAPEA